MGWYDAWLTEEERHGQVSSRAARARKKKRTIEKITSGTAETATQAVKNLRENSPAKDILRKAYDERRRRKLNGR